MRALALCIAFGVAGPAAQAAAGHGQAAELDDEAVRPIEEEPALAELDEIRARPQAGDARHQLYPGALYEFGEKRSKRDLAEAAKWYAKAADQGLARAHVRLGFLCEEGKGVGAGIGKAMALYRQSAEQVDAWGQAALGLCYMQGRGVEQKAGVPVPRAGVQAGAERAKLPAFSLERQRCPMPVLLHPLTRRRAIETLAVPLCAAAWPAGTRGATAGMQSWPLRTPQATGIHDVAPAPDGGVWFTAQRSGHLGWFDPMSGRAELVALGPGSAPHGVIQGPDKAAWITDGGQGAIVRVAWPGREVQRFALPEGTPYANLNTCAFDGDGDLWFTGQSGVVGRVERRSGKVSVKDAPRGRGPYGICATPGGEVWWCSLAGSFIAHIDRKSGESTVVEPPTKDQGARRVWSDARGRIWVSEWNSGQLSVYDPAAKSWRAWKLPGDKPRAYAVYVDERQQVWVSDFGGNAVFRFDPGTEAFERFGFSREAVNVRQILGRPGEVWLPESGTEHISVIRTV